MAKKKKQINSLAVLQERYRQGTGKEKALEKEALRFMTYHERRDFKSLNK